MREGVSAGKRRTQTDQRRKIKIFDNEKYDGGWPSYFSVERLCCLKRRFRSRFCSGEVIFSTEISLLENNIPVLPRAHPAERGIPLLKEKLLFFLDKQPKRTPFIV